MPSAPVLGISREKAQPAILQFVANCASIITHTLQLAQDHDHCAEVIAAHNDIDHGRASMIPLGLRVLVFARA
jgi:hypothetical protein